MSIVQRLLHSVKIINYAYWRQAYLQGLIIIQNFCFFSFTTQPSLTPSAAGG